MGSEPLLACTCEKKVDVLAPPAKKASADLKKLQQILKVVQLPSNLRNNCAHVSRGYL